MQYYQSEDHVLREEHDYENLLLPLGGQSSPMDIDYEFAGEDFQLDGTISTNTNENEETEIYTANNGQYSMIAAVFAEDEHATSNFEDEIDGGETDDEHQILDCINLESSDCPVSSIES